MPLFSPFPGSAPEFKHNTDRPSSDRLADLESAFAELSSVVDRMNSRVGNHDSRIGGLEDSQAEQQQFNAEHESRIQAPTSVANFRSCPSCGGSYPDGVGHWPGYTSSSYPGDPRCRKCFPKDGR
jgi:hypothetical protein